MISVLIPTRNEQQDLPACLESVRWSDDIHVYDSNSTDLTVRLAERMGARVCMRSSDPSQEIFAGDEAGHKNWALKNIPFKYEWVLHIDADERVSPELAASLRAAVQRPGRNVAFRIRRRDFWGDRWLRHAVASSYYIRLFRPERMRYERVINPISVPDGAVDDLHGYLDHYPFSKGMTHWLSKHNSYSSLEARQIEQNRSLQQPFSLRRAFLAKDRNERRFHQKEVFYRMPARPLLKFLLLYVGKRGALDGSAGLRYAILQSFYEYMIVLKTKERSSAPALTTGPQEAAMSSANARLESQ